MMTSCLGCNVCQLRPLALCIQGLSLGYRSVSLLAKGEAEGLIYKTRSNLKGGFKLPPLRVVIAKHHSRKDTSGGSFFNLTGNISQILFDGGTLKAKSRAAEQALLQAGAQYRSTVITALQNVADTLYTINTDADALKAASNAEHASKIVLDHTSEQYQQGYVSYQNLLAAQQSPTFTD